MTKKHFSIKIIEASLNNIYNFFKFSLNKYSDVEREREKVGLKKMVNMLGIYVDKRNEKSFIRILRVSNFWDIRRQ